MKLRLQITTGSGASFAFEHAGPDLRIGRDPETELALAGEASQSVSWRHARIELTPQGAFLTDLGSSNGSLLNDQRISGPRLGEKRRPHSTGVYRSDAAHRGTGSAGSVPSASAAGSACAHRISIRREPQTSG